MRQKLGTNANKVSSFGMSFDDHGNASFFAVVDKSLAKQRERIAAKREENLKAKKQEAKKAEKRKAEERAEARRAGSEEDEEVKMIDKTDKVTVTAKSWDELFRKIDDVIMTGMADGLMTASERNIGQHFDFAL